MAMENQVNLQRSKILHLENVMPMYGIYNSDTWEKLTDLCIKSIIKQLGTKNCLQVNSGIGINGIKPKREFNIMP